MIALLTRNGVKQLDGWSVPIQTKIIKDCGRRIRGISDHVQSSGSFSIINRSDQIIACLTGRGANCEVGIGRQGQFRIISVIEGNRIARYWLIRRDIICTDRTKELNRTEGHTWVTHTDTGGDRGGWSGEVADKNVCDLIGVIGNQIIRNGGERNLQPVFRGGRAAVNGWLSAIGITASGAGGIHTDQHWFTQRLTIRAEFTTPNLRDKPIVNYAQIRRFGGEGHHTAVQRNFRGRCIVVGWNPLMGRNQARGDVVAKHTCSRRIAIMHEDLHCKCGFEYRLKLSIQIGCQRFKRDEAPILTNRWRIAAAVRGKTISCDRYSLSAL